MTDLQRKRLERITNRHTLYEVTGEEADGSRFLFCYSGNSGSALLRAFRGRLERVLARYGEGREWSFDRRKNPSVFCPAEGVTFRFSGRTEREAILDGELPYLEKDGRLETEGVLA